MANQAHVAVVKGNSLGQVTPMDETVQGGAILRRIFEETEQKEFEAECESFGLQVSVE